ncbi:ABC transporter ATP-binding protein [Natronogracilivirga saccharolytica]|uniref:ABC transporter ATP-binding protein n=1 Tax=Natronogracilivirga saccharolytica TaxID=2812953 RepID=A0A8J7UWP2_9BACT|nr:ABC transporter ATP-binding protein [Natronogracilivirga saccharolytica]MBP3193847.1 ABC transporter ATP-binding protein [Natronogracilivirga saccharolytica]
MLTALRKIIYLLPKGDPVKLVILFFMMMFAALLEVAGIGMIPAFVSIVADPDRVLQYEPVERIFASLNITTSRELLIWGGGALIVIFVVKNLYMIAYFYIQARFVYKRNYTISRELMTSYMQAPYTFHLQRNTAELLRNSTQEVRMIVKQVLKPVLELSKELVMVLSIILFLVIMEPVISLIVFLVMGSTVGSFLLLTQKKMKKYGREEQKMRREMIKSVNQGLGGIKDARVLNREDEFINVFRKASLRSSRLMTVHQFLAKIPKPVVETLAVVGIMLIAVTMVIQGRPITAIIPIMALFAMATVRLMPAVQQITSILTRLRYNIVSVDPVYNDMVELAEYRKILSADRDRKERFLLKNNIEIKDVHYHYPESDEQALNGVSFIIPRGKAVAFTGSSGAGKTTVVDLLLGLLEPQSGSVLVDGKDINDNLSAWQRNIGYIPQFIYLADETLRQNIAFGLPGDKIDDKQVWKAVRLAQLEDLVHRLPHGLDTIIGERGTRLSGGQRQRVGIARALYHDPQVLVMDEATSALDNITEKQIIKAIEELKGERTIIMIAHRLTTVMNCDILYLMDAGKIVKQGTYQELISSSKQFREMAMEQ